MSAGDHSPVCGADVNGLTLWLAAKLIREHPYATTGFDSGLGEVTIASVLSGRTYRIRISRISDATPFGEATDAR